MYGFIGIPNEIVYDLISHPLMGRLRNIRQLGLTHLVYPGAVHSRFHHALGALHLSNLVIETLRLKEVDISPEEGNGLRSALLLHDVGHSPFSHSLENILVKCDHETLTEMAMEKLNEIFEGKLTLAIAIFKGTYHRRFLHQLVSGQLDLDRLDYLNRDSFYTGVAEGVVSFDRIIKMLNVFQDELVLEEKALYSVEKFLMARRLMYWQVYLHKTVIASEQLLLKIMQRAKELFSRGEPLFCSPYLKVFLENQVNAQDLIRDAYFFEAFMMVDDSDIWSAIKLWAKSEDFILKKLCTALVNRTLYHIDLQEKAFQEDRVKELERKMIKDYSIGEEEVSYFVFTGKTWNLAYNQDLEGINLLRKDKSIVPLVDLSDFFKISGITSPVEKHFLCYFRI